MESAPSPLPNEDMQGEVNPGARVTPVEQLHDELHDLFVAVGEPPVARMLELAELAEIPIGRTTLYDVLNRKGMPTWPTVKAFIATCVEVADVRGLPDAVPEKWRDPRWLRHIEELREDAERVARTQSALQPTRRKTRVRSAYVIGGDTNETTYPEYENAVLAQFCYQLGVTIADSGADLIVCSPFPDSADFHALMGYLHSDIGGTVHLHTPRHARVHNQEAELRAMLGDAAAGRIMNWYYPGPEVDDKESWGQSWLLCQLMALDRADVVIAVGGRVSNTANTILHLAEARQIPIVPFEFMGGAARRAYNRRSWNQTYPGLDHLKLKDRNAVVDAMGIADHLITARMRKTSSYASRPRKFFISRARLDAEFARVLDSYLSSAGLSVLFGEKDLPAGQTIESAIETAVLRSDVFIVLWSRSYAASRYCYDEIQLALQRHRAGELRLWIVNLDGSDVVPPGARNLPQVIARTPEALITVIQDLLEHEPDTGA